MAGTLPEKVPATFLSNALILLGEVVMKTAASCDGAEWQTTWINVRRSIMPRRRRVYPDGLAFHVINRGNRRGRIFLGPTDYEDFLDAMAAATAQTGMRVLAFCLMSNHWHLVLWPRESRDLSTYMQRLMNRHIRVYQKRHGTSGTGHIYQGRFKSVPIEDERELLKVCRYVNANPLRAGLVDKAEAWPWSDISRQTTKDGTFLLSDWPHPRPGDWLEVVNRPQSEKMVKPIRSAIVRARFLVAVAKDCSD